MKKGIVRTFGKGFTLSINGKSEPYINAKVLVEALNKENVVVTNPMALSPMYRRRLKHHHKFATVNLKNEIYTVYGADGNELFSDTPSEIVRRCNEEAIEVVNKNNLADIFREGLAL